MIKHNFVAVILAGGKSERMGQPKGLLDFYGKPWLFEQLNRLKSAGITRVLIGLGFDSELYFKAIPFLKEAQNQTINWVSLQIKTVVNSSPELGSFSTLKNVLKIIDITNNILVIPIDVPLINSKSLESFMRQKEDVVKPQFQGKSGHPILLKSKVLTDLLNLPDTARLDDFIASNPQYSLKLWNCKDEQILLNINTPKVWEDFKIRFDKTL